MTFDTSIHLHIDDHVFSTDFSKTLAGGHSFTTVRLTHGNASLVLYVTADSASMALALARELHAVAVRHGAKEDV